MKNVFLTIIPIIISFIALIASQFEPFYKYFETSRIEISIPNQIVFQHSWGNVGASQYLQIRNVGKKSGVINKIIYVVQSKENPDNRKILPSQSYYLKPSSLQAGTIVTQVPLGELYLKPDEVWDYFVLSYRSPAKNDQGLISDMTVKVKEQIQKQWDPKVPFGQSRPQIEPALFSKIEKFSKDKLAYFKKGEYFLLVFIWQNNEQTPTFKKLYAFSIFESDLYLFKQQIEEMKFGVGVSSVPQFSMNITSELTEISDLDQVQKMYNSILNYL